VHWLPFCFFFFFSAQAGPRADADVGGPHHDRAGRGRHSGPWPFIRSSIRAQPPGRPERSALVRPGAGGRGRMRHRRQGRGGLRRGRACPQSKAAGRGDGGNGGDCGGRTRKATSAAQARGGPPPSPRKSNIAFAVGGKGRSPALWPADGRQPRGDGWREGRTGMGSRPGQQVGRITGQVAGPANTSGDVRRGARRGHMFDAPLRCEPT